MPSNQQSARLADSRADSRDAADHALLEKYIEAHKRRGTQPARQTMERFAKLAARIGRRAS